MRRESLGTSGRHRDHALTIVVLGAVLFGICAAFFPPYLIWVVAAVGAAPIAMVLVTGRGDPLRPFTLVPFTYALYAVGPLLHHLPYGPEARTTYVLLHTVGLLSLMFGLRFGEGRVSGIVEGTINPEAEITDLRLTVWCLLTLGATSIATQLAAFGGLGTFVELGYGTERVGVQRSTNSFGAGFEWWMLACILLWFVAHWAGGRLRKAVALFLALPVVLILLQIGGRSTIVYAALFAVVLFHYGVRRIPPRAAVVGLVCGLLLAQLYNLARFYLSEGLWVSAREALRIVLTAPQVLLPTAANEFSAPSAALLDLLEYRPWDRLYGSTYLSGATVMVPGLTDLLGLGSSNPSLDRLRDFYPAFYAEGRGLGFSPAAEGWLNFGAVGVVLHLGLYGWTFGRIYREFLRKRTLTVLILLAGVAPMFILDGLRIHSGAFLYKGLRVYMLPFFVFVVLRALHRRRPTLAPERG
jgi:oligosaccharide repeat unit polymerase